MGMCFHCAHFPASCTGRSIVFCAHDSTRVVDLDLRPVADCRSPRDSVPVGIATVMAPNAGRLDARGKREPCVALHFATSRSLLASRARAVGLASSRSVPIDIVKRVDAFAPAHQLPWYRAVVLVDDL